MATVRLLGGPGRLPESNQQCQSTNVKLLIVRIDIRLMLYDQRESHFPTGGNQVMWCAAQPHTSEVYVTTCHITMSHGVIHPCLATIPLTFFHCTTGLLCSFKSIFVLRVKSVRLSSIN